MCVCVVSVGVCSECSSVCRCVYSVCIVCVGV